VSEFYTNVALRGNQVLLRGKQDGKSIKKKIELHPTLFLPANSETKFKTLDGKHVEPIKPGTIKECRDFIKRYEGVRGFDVYGNTDYIYQFINAAYKGEVDYDPTLIKTAYIDIETTCEHGFPNVDSPREKIIAITVDFGDNKYILGLGEFKLDEDAEQHSFETEEDLLNTFLDIWDYEAPDIITGWNVRFFDIPYMVNRIRQVCDNQAANRLSPWRSIRQRTVTRMNREHTVFEPVGISVLDYYELYQTFTYVNQESYRLDHIAWVELGQKKLSYEEFDSMAEFYKKDFQKFMEYNSLDVELVIRLEEKMKLLELACALAYSAKVNFVDVFSQVKTWDQIIYHYLAEQNIVIPPKKAGNKDSQYAGAYVKDPITGMHDWVVSLDLNSLYPHLIMQYNISPETQVDPGEDHFGMGPDNILKTVPEKYWKGCHEKLERFKSMGYSVAANGTCYTKKRQGFLPALMEKMYKERKMYKEKMIEAQKLQQEIPKMNMPTLGRHALNEKCKRDIAKYNNFQMVRKIQLNSAYGAIGNQYFRYYDTDLAEAITLSGQLSIRWIADKLNAFLNKICRTEDYDFVVASDTDSVYLRLGTLVDKVCTDSKNIEEVVNFLDKSCEDIIVPFIKKKYDELARLTNAYENKMVMDRECIADKGIWTAKKRYMLNVHDSEGVRYETPKMKIMGIETTRSSTPHIVRERLKSAIKLIMSTDEETIIKFIDETRDEFMQAQPEDIAFPRGVSGLDRYIDSNSIYRKSTPIAVKGALIYNHYLKTHGITGKYAKINEGEKIKFLYLKTPNPLGGMNGTDHVVSFANSLPKEFGLCGYIDYDKQFQKAFLDPLKSILDIIGWKHEKVTTLESLFG
jgi:DNA polymerase elongation subunit (family B)